MGSLVAVGSLGVGASNSDTLVEVGMGILVKTIQKYIVTLTTESVFTLKCKNFTHNFFSINFNQ